MVDRHVRYLGGSFWDLPDARASPSARLGTAPAVDGIIHLFGTKPNGVFGTGRGLDARGGGELEPAGDDGELVAGADADDVLGGEGGGRGGGGLLELVGETGS